MDLFCTTKLSKASCSHHNMAMNMDEQLNSCCSSCYFFRIVKEQNPLKRRPALAKFFSEMPFRDDESDVLVMSALWSIAMTGGSGDPELPSLGAFRCMSLLITKAILEPAWLRRHQNIYIPYYAAHVLGSYTISHPSIADIAVAAGAIPPLLGLLDGAMSWVEQRVAVRALGHLASYDGTYPAVAQHKEKVVALAMRLASSCLEMVYAEFFAVAPSKREKYHCDLLTRGLGGMKMENRKAEEWASQLQCWSLYLLSCMASRDKSSHEQICSDVGFLKELCQMWGGIVNGDSPAGAGLMRILCRSEVGREAMAECREAIESLCNLSRSSDDWQYMGIDCLLLLVDDRRTRQRVMEIAAPCLVDLAELRSLGARESLGETITKALLSDFDHEAHHVLGNEAEAAIKSLWELNVVRKKREELMSKKEAHHRQFLAAAKKKEANEKFSSGNIEEAIVRYAEVLELCPLSRRKERLVLYSNRAQCHLLLQDPEAAISDATRALALARPVNGHPRSLWRRSQAYDMKGMEKESLMDAIMFLNVSIDENKGKERKKVRIPYHAVRMINKQMNAVGLFAGFASRTNKARRSKIDDDDDDDEDYDDDHEEEDGRKASTLGFGLSTIEEEPWPRRESK